MSSRLDYRADLDGLRAVAVVPVVMFHLGLPGVPGGFVGVDVFFVLSGFFITRLIDREAAAGRFSLLGFYDRRIRRLFPALFAMLLVSAVAAMAILPPHDLKRFGLTLAAAATSTSNFAFWAQSGYFAPEAASQPLLHTWSLAVEEQFYIGFPLLFMLAWKHGRPRVVGLIALIGAASLALSIWGTTAYPKAAFYLIPTRAWELALGGLLALGVVPPLQSRWLQNVSTMLGLAAIVTAIVVFDEGVPFPGLAAVLPCLGCALVIWARLGEDQPGAAGPRPPVLAARVLMLPPLVFIGLISYSFYLWHWPIIVFAKQAAIEPLDAWDRGAIAIATLAAAILSWKLIEQPLRSGKRFWPAPRHRFALSGAATAMVLVAGLSAYAAAGFPQLLPRDALALSRQVDDLSPKREECHSTDVRPIEFSQTCLVGKENSRHVVVFADSHGVELSYALFEVAEENGLQVRQLTASECAPADRDDLRHRPVCVKYIAEMLAALQREPHTTVIMTAYFSELVQSEGKAEPFWRGFEKSVAILREAGHDVVILGDVPTHPNGRVPDALVKWWKLGRTLESYEFPINTTLLRGIDARLRAVAARNGATYLPLLPYVCGGTEGCHGYAGGHAIYFDDDHLSVAIARGVVKNVILPALAALAVETSSLPDLPAEGQDRGQHSAGATSAPKPRP